MGNAKMACWAVVVGVLCGGALGERGERGRGRRESDPGEEGKSYGKVLKEVMGGTSSDRGKTWRERRDGDDLEELSDSLEHHANRDHGRWGEAEGPDVSIVSPAEGAFVGGLMEVEVSYQANEELPVKRVRTVVLFMDGWLVGYEFLVPASSSGTVSFRVRTNWFDEGAHELKAFARQGFQWGESEAVQVNVDHTGPEAFDLEEGISVSDGLSCWFQAPGDVLWDDTVVGVSSYEGRYSPSPFDEETWDQAEEIPEEGIPSPAEPGADQEVIVTGLTNETVYYVGVAALDEAGNRSFSNVVELQTQGQVQEIHGEIGDRVDLEGGTWWVSGPVIVKEWGRLTCSERAVLKMGRNASVVCELGGRVLMKGLPGRPVVMTSENDDEIGESIQGSNHNPMAGDYPAGLCLTEGCQTDWLEVRYAEEYGIRMAAGADIRNGIIEKIEGIGIEVVKGGAGQGETVWNQRIGNVDKGIVVQAGASEEVWHVTVHDCNATGILIEEGGQLELMNSIIAYCATGIEDQNGTSAMTGGWNGYYENAPNFAGSAQALEEDIEVADGEMPFAMDGATETLYLKRQTSIPDPETPFVDHGNQYAGERGLHELTTHLPPESYTGAHESKGRYSDGYKADLGYHEGVDKTTQYLIREGVVAGEERWRGGWTYVLTPNFIGIPQDEGIWGRLIIEPGCVIKFATTAPGDPAPTPLASGKEMLQSRSLLLGGEHGLGEWESMEEVLAELRDGTGISVGAKSIDQFLGGQKASEARGKLLVEPMQKRESSGEGPMNYGVVLAVGTAENPIIETIVYDDTVGVDTDGEDSGEGWEEPWPEEEIEDEKWAEDPTVLMPEYGMGFSYMGSGYESRLEFAEIRYAQTGLWLMQKLGNPIQHNRFLRCGRGIMDWAAGVQDVSGRTQMVRNNLFSNYGFTDAQGDAVGMGLWTLGWEPPGGVVTNNTFDHLGIGLLAVGVFWLEEEWIYGDVESNLFTRCEVGIQTYNPDLGDTVDGNAFWDVPTPIDVSQDLFGGGKNIALSSTPYTDTDPAVGDWCLIQTEPAVNPGDVNHTAFEVGLAGMTTNEDGVSPDVAYVDIGYHHDIVEEGGPGITGLAGWTEPDWVGAEWHTYQRWDEVSFVHEECVSLLVDHDAGWTDGSLVGLTVRPNVFEYREYVIKDNTETTVSVYGDVTGWMSGEGPIAEAGDRYEIHDYHLDTASEAIDKGKDTGVATDIDGNARPVDGGTGSALYDLGADEYLGTGTPPVYPGPTPPAPSTQVFVDQTATGGSGTGESWENAFLTMGAALGSITIPDDLPAELWVAEGAYDENVSVPSQVSLFGGFEGNEATREEADPWTHETKIMGNGTASVVTLASETILDGFTVEGGVEGSPVTIGEVSFFAGGGILAGDGVASLQDVWIRRCTIQSNRVLSSGEEPTVGGGVSLLNVTNAEIRECFIKGNEASQGQGGGVYILGGTSLIVGSDIQCNKATWGGGVFLDSTLTGTVVSNALVMCNQGSFRGGGIHTFESEGRIEYSFLCGNEAGNAGGLAAWGGNIFCEGNWIAGNWAPVAAGGILATGGTHLRSNMILGNASSSGGGVYLDDFSGDIFNNTIATNGGDLGGGVYVDGDVTGAIENNLFVENADCAIHTSPESSTPPVNNNGFFRSDAGVYRQGDGTLLKTADELNGLFHADDNEELVPGFVGTIPSGSQEVRLIYSTEGYVEIPETGDTVVDVTMESNWTWDSPNDGTTYYLVIQVSTDGGNTWLTADQAQVTCVDLTPPSAPTLTTVTPNAYGWVAAEVRMEGSCSTDSYVTKVEIFEEDLGGDVVTPLINDPGTGKTSWMLEPAFMWSGRNIVRITASDAAGNETVSQDYEVWSDQWAPRGVVIAPAPGTTVTIEKY